MDFDLDKAYPDPRDADLRNYKCRTCGENGEDCECDEIAADWVEIDDEPDEPDDFDDEPVCERFYDPWQ